MSGPWALRRDPRTGAQEQKQSVKGRDGRPRASMGQKLGLPLTLPQRRAPLGLRVCPQHPSPGLAPLQEPLIDPLTCSAGELGPGHRTYLHP